MKTVKIVTLGCRVNLYESDALAGMLEKAGYRVVREGAADWLVLNTCTVTDEAGRKCRQTLRRLHREDPEMKILVCGCYSQMLREKAKELLPEADILCGNGEKDKIPAFITAFDQKNSREKEFYTGDIMEKRSFDRLLLTDYKGRTRSFLKIEDGCDQFCGYCVIPYVRGPIRSKDLSAAVEEAEYAVSRGFKELVLTGIHLGRYGQEHGQFGLSDLLKELKNIDGLERIRLSSIELNELTDDVVEELMSSSKFCRHLHVPLQAGSTRTLSAMGRSYTAEEFMAGVKSLRDRLPGLNLTTDVIAGYPGETDEDFEESYNFCKEAGFSKLHAFPYSRREGTRAAEAPGQLTREEKAQRARRLVALSDELTEAFDRAAIGEQHTVLFEEAKEVDGLWHNVGYTDHYLRVSAVTGRDLSGLILSVELTDYQNGQLVARIL